MRKPQLSQWDAFAEIFGTFGTVLPLVLVGGQPGDNTGATRAASYRIVDEFELQLLLRSNS